MTDYFGRVAEVEKVNGVPTVAMTKDRSIALRKALGKLGFPPLPPRNVKVDNQGTDSDLTENNPSDPAYNPGEDFLEFDPEIDPDGLQDLLDDLRFTQDRHIVRQVL